MLFRSVRLTAHAKWRNLWTDKDTEDTLKEASERITKLINDCEKWPPPKVETLFEDVYESLPAHLEKQKDDYLSFLAHQREQEDH